MQTEKVVGTMFALILLAAITGVAILIKKGEAKSGVVLILLLIPFIYLFTAPMIHGNFPQGVDNIARTLIIGVIASIVGGAILLSLKK